MVEDPATGKRMAETLDAHTINVLTRVRNQESQIATTDFQESMQDKVAPAVGSAIGCATVC